LPPATVIPLLLHVAFAQIPSFGIGGGGGARREIDIHVRFSIYLHYLLVVDGDVTGHRASLAMLAG
jgi:hypothetical protein